VEGLATNPPDLAPKFPAYSDLKGRFIKGWNGGGRKPRQDTKSPHHPKRTDRLEGNRQLP